MYDRTNCRVNWNGTVHPKKRTIIHIPSTRSTLLKHTKLASHLGGSQLGYHKPTHSIQCQSSITRRMGMDSSRRKLETQRDNLATSLRGSVKTWISENKDDIGNNGRILKKITATTVDECQQQNIWNRCPRKIYITTLSDIVLMKLEKFYLTGAIFINVDEGQKEI